MKVVMVIVWVKEVGVREGVREGGCVRERVGEGGGGDGDSVGEGGDGEGG